MMCVPPFDLPRMQTETAIMLALQRERQWAAGVRHHASRQNAEGARLMAARPRAIPCAYCKIDRAPQPHCPGCGAPLARKAL